MSADDRNLKRIFCQEFLGQSEFGSCLLWLYSCHNERGFSLLKKS